MFQVLETEEFTARLDGLRDREARRRVTARIHRIHSGLIGDWRSVGRGVLELRIHYGPGYRVYASVRGDSLVLLLGGGTKGSQSEDIRE